MVMGFYYLCSGKGYKGMKAIDKLECKYNQIFRKIELMFYFIIFYDDLLNAFLKFSSLSQLSFAVIIEPIVKLNSARPDNE